MEGFGKRPRMALLAFCFLLLTGHLEAKTPEPLKEWTVLVFLNGHNNLDPFGHEDVNEMEKVGSTDKVNVVVQWASLSNGRTRRLLVQKDNDPYNVTSPTVESLSPVDMGSRDELIKFLKWGMRKYPAKRYFVDVWNHGNGWRDVEPSQLEVKGSRIVKNISYDDLTNNKINTVDLAKAMREVAKFIGRKIDVYGSDACLMGMVEIASEMRASVSYFVGSQETEPGAGWPYDIWLNLVRQYGGALSGKDMAVSLLKAYNFSYGPRGDQRPSSTTLSVLDLSKIDNLNNSLRLLKDRVLAGGVDTLSAFTGSYQNAVSFDYADYVDIGDVMKGFALRTRDRAALQAANAVQVALQNTVVANRTRDEKANARGLSIWLPPEMETYRGFLRDYQRLQFEQATGWSQIMAPVIGTIENSSSDIVDEAG